MKPKYTFLLSLTFLFVLVTLFLLSCSRDNSTKEPKVENPKVKESFDNHVKPKFESLDMDKLKEWGFRTSYSFANEKFDDELKVEFLPVTSQTEKEIEVGYMRGNVILTGSLLSSGRWNYHVIFLKFVKLSKDESWKMITYDGHIEDYKIYDYDDPPTNRPLPPEFQTYIKSMFQTIEQMEYYQFLSNRK